MERLLALDHAPDEPLAAAADLFPAARAPEAALAGLWLHWGEWNRAHEVAQEIETPEGSYWHASMASPVLPTSTAVQPYWVYG